MLRFELKYLSSCDTSSKTHPGFEKDSFDYAGGCGGHLDIFCFPFVKGRLFNSIEKDNGQYDYDDEIFWASGTAMMIIKKEFYISF